MTKQPTSLCPTLSLPTLLTISDAPSLNGLKSTKECWHKWKESFSSITTKPTKTHLPASTWHWKPTSLSLVKMWKGLRVDPLCHALAAFLLPWAPGLTKNSNQLWPFNHRTSATVLHSDKLYSNLNYHRTPISSLLMLSSCIPTAQHLQQSTISPKNSTVMHLHMIMAILWWPSKVH